MATLGVDFGTSNTAAAVFDDGRVRVIPLEEGAATIPTAVFLDFADRTTLFGSDAAAAMIGGRDGRFLRGLKSILGTPLARERRQFLNERLTLVEIIGRFLAHVKARAEAGTGQRFDAVLSGRPVHFHSADAGRDAQALVDLAEAYRLAGFAAVEFLAEPEAAALAAGPGDRLALIVDIGGGTSDFTLFESGTGGVRVLASHGVRLGGTDFDRVLSIAHVMPLLGLGASLRREFGPGLQTAPVGMFHDLAAWEKIAFLYAPDLVRDVARMRRLAERPRLFARLSQVLEMHLGHDLAYAVEAAKIHANKGSLASIDLRVVEAGLAPALSPGDLAVDLAGFAGQIASAAAQTLEMARVAPAEVGRVIFVGGSSLMATVRGALAGLLPKAQAETAEVFTAVVDGLALAASGKAPSR
jgi:hypothetical chaperone protein